MNYPAGKWTNNTDQLLFDLGCSYGLLARAEEFLHAYLEVLKAIAPSVPTGQAEELLSDLSQFRNNRLHSQEEIYACAEAAAARITKVQKNGKD